MIYVKNHTIRYRVITLCGSTKFKDTFREVAQNLELNGTIVLAPNVYSGYENKKYDVEILDTLYNIHLSKIDMSDGIFVINVGGYIGSSTKREIEYAKKMGKSVTYLEEVNEKDMNKKKKVVK